jgi:hypothetical protein
MGAGKAGGSRRRVGVAILTLSASLSLALFAIPPAAAEAPFEPNDSLLSAAGPLAVGQTYDAAIETAGDKDFFYFYVTATPAAQVTLTVKNLGGGTGISDIDATIMGSSATPVGGASFVEKGEARTVTVRLEPGKYFAELVANEGYGDTYSLGAAGSKGAFGQYGQIAARCASATASAESLRKRLPREKVKLQRALNRLRRARFGSRDARAAARAAYTKAKSHASSDKRALRAAVAEQQPWCSIPQ